MGSTQAEELGMSGRVTSHTGSSACIQIEEAHSLLGLQNNSVFFLFTMSQRPELLLGLLQKQRNLALLSTNSKQAGFGCSFNPYVIVVWGDRRGLHTGHLVVMVTVDRGDDGY